MLKCSSERCVCAPHKRSSGTWTSPRASFSIRNSFAIVKLMIFELLHNVRHALACGLRDKLKFVGHFAYFHMSDAQGTPRTRNTTRKMAPKIVPRRQ